MSQASAFTALPAHAADHRDELPRAENPGRAFANGLLLALPLWGLIGLAIWAIV
ncbi:hypothetical protein AAFN86_19255 [Roseomonas sp. CAU 1739]|uniref:hypothetical protein n=1 Tax=Roseomonas sp. CAU 1739 TaxID=3140364 RepID=UPI00325A63A0